MKCAKCCTKDVELRLNTFSYWNDADKLIENCEAFSKVARTYIDVYCSHCSGSATLTNEQILEIRTAFKDKVIKLDKINAHIKYEDKNQVDLFAGAYEKN